VGLDPIATIGSYSSYLLVEWPLPWPRDISDAGALGELAPMLAAARCRLQGVVVTGSVASRRVALYWSEGPEFTRYMCVERVVPAVEVTRCAAELLEASLGREIDNMAIDAGSEVLVCTHGRRDRCCGSLGTSLALQLVANPGRLGADTRVGRTSHTGGHRFAPTALVFPEGTAWAFADVDLLTRVVARRGSLADILPRYRGCAGLRSRGVQALERAVLAEVGWELFDLARRGEDSGDGTARLQVSWPDGSTAEWEAEVEAGRELPVPDCGAPLAAARKSEVEMVVRGLHQVR
jgi:hypothetical protein